MQNVTNETKLNTKVDEVIIQRYKTLSGLINMGTILKSEASLINYVFSVRKVLSDPKKHSTKDVEVIQRDSESCEMALMDSFRNSLINQVALRACKELHNLVYRGFAFYDPIPENERRSEGDTSIEELLARIRKS